ncbi:hypothetical protein BJV78DRAFT_1253861 [Lactifluus subvellereus]|nr:hypothetical protein BJV78DRAFT_1253861 [Lactifluus subvellereus]
MRCRCRCLLLLLRCAAVALTLPPLRLLLPPPCCRSRCSSAAPCRCCSYAGIGPSARVSGEGRGWVARIGPSRLPQRPRRWCGCGWGDAAGMAAAAATVLARARSPREGAGTAVVSGHGESVTALVRQQ